MSLVGSLFRLKSYGLCFGSFHVRDKQARIGRNPKTGQEAAIPPRRVVRFQSGKSLKKIR